MDSVETNKGSRQRPAGGRNASAGIITLAVFVAVLVVLCGQDKSNVLLSKERNLEKRIEGLKRDIGEVETLRKRAASFDVGTYTSYPPPPVSACPHPLLEHLLS